MTIKHQIRIDAALRALGGYWHPLAGLARVLEELGEFSSASSAQERLREAADCVVATLALANQYCVETSEPLHLNFDDEKRALVAAGHLARIVNRFEGAKPPKPLEKNEFSLQRVISEIVDGVAKAVKTEREEIIELAAQTAEGNVKRDARRFSWRDDAISVTTRDQFWEVAGYGLLTPVTGLWGSYGSPTQQKSQIQRFQRVDIVHPLAGLVSAPIESEIQLSKTMRNFREWAGKTPRIRSFKGTKNSESMYFVLLDGQSPLSGLRNCVA